MSVFDVFLYMPVLCEKPIDCILLGLRKASNLPPKFNKHFPTFVVVALVGLQKIAKGCFHAGWMT